MIILISAFDYLYEYSFERETLKDPDNKLNFEVFWIHKSKERQWTMRS